MEVRKLEIGERDEWLKLRASLWPEMPLDELVAELDEILADEPNCATLVAAAPGGNLVGFVEVSLRDWAEGCATRPVGYIEGWYVEPGYRRAGIGRQLIAAAEAWAIARGCTEMGSDANLQNVVSHRAHCALGYGEVGRLVLFSKKLAR